VGAFGLSLFGPYDVVDGKMVCRWYRRLKANATQPVTSTNFPRRDRPLIINQASRIGREEAEWKPYGRVPALHEPSLSKDRGSTMFGQVLCPAKREESRIQDE
jgi:hypothetical protein